MTNIQTSLIPNLTIPQRQAEAIELISHLIEVGPEGADIDEICDAFGWSRRKFRYVLIEARRLAEADYDLMIPYSTHLDGYHYRVEDQFANPDAPINWSDSEAMAIRHELTRAESTRRRIEVLRRHFKGNTREGRLLKRMQLGIDLFDEGGQSLLDLLAPPVANGHAPN